MHRLAWLLLLVGALAWLASQIPSSGQGEAPLSAATVWRRTTDGWERLPARPAPTACPTPRRCLHPLIVAMLEILIVAVLPVTNGPRRSRHVPMPSPSGSSRRGPVATG